MKLFFKKYGLALCGLALLSGAGCNGGGCNPMGYGSLDSSQILLNASWETGDSTVWTQASGSSSLSLSNTADTGTGAGLLTFSSSGSPAEAYASMTPTSRTRGYVELSFSFQPLSSSSSSLTEFHLIQDGLDRAGLRYDSSGSGSLQAYSSGSWHNLPATVFSNQWNYFEVELNLRNHQYTVYNDGYRIGSLYNAGETLNARSGWSFSISNASSPGYSLLLDNIFAYVTN